ncbi:FAD-dependent oxidoreductase [Algoriphagus halophilus]|uniref:FAD/FMN-containing dehydrogenase n=1 Tax=Algoriphagus halophilus TaxID=226505 RepID=A0A1N6G1J1_9BACT|nr:FAD-binding oxidoreductase [Algoriphagus halophilus]SIO01419.1 FAD/FMN-containing dehydrogenase [Algoriphagus halophilus]
MSHRLTPLQEKKAKSLNFLRSKKASKKIPSSYKLSLEKLAKLEEKLHGKVVYPWSKGYNKDRQEFDDLYPTYPKLIVYSLSFTDIRKCLTFAKSENLQVAIRSSGHSLACFSVCDGMVIDLSLMKSIHVDKDQLIADVESGANFGDLYPKIEQYNLHTPTGDCPTVCPSGFMMGGGYSITSRMYGMGCDNVKEVKVMLADGKIVIANEEKNKDLFWAIRGGTGGNFGVLLNTKLKLHPLETIFGVQMRWPIEKDPALAAKVLFTIQESYLKPGKLPQLGIETIISSNDNKEKMVFFCATWIGSEKDFMDALKPLLDISGFSMDSYQGKYSKVNNLVLEGTPDIPEDVMAFSRSTYIDKPLGYNHWYDILKFFYKHAPNQYTMIDMEAYGGNVSLIPEDNCAFIHRNVTMDFFTEAFFNKETHDRGASEKWVNDLFEFMKPLANGRSYQNYPYRGQEDFRTAYWGKYYNQLVQIKKKYDPDNFFWYQQSIGPDLIEDPNQVTLFENCAIEYEAY